MTTNPIKKIGHTFMHGESVVPTFLRSVLSSQAASWIDLGSGFLLFAFIGLPPWLSTGLGAVAGGVINCIINYKFTFHASDCPWKAVILKYFMVWIGSILLNAAGTQLLYYILVNWQWLETVGFKPDGYYAAARIAVSLIVSWAWNFQLQRNFVYRNRSFDARAIVFVDRFMHPFLSRTENITENQKS